METQNGHEQRMEALATRQAKALESLANYAQWWTICIPLIALVVLVLWKISA